MGPMRIRRKSRTGRPTALHILRIWRFRPSRMVMVRSVVGLAPLTVRADVDVGGRGAAAFDVDALAQLLEAARIGRAHHDHLIDLVHFMPRMHQARGEIAVGHHQQQAFGVVIEPADRIDVGALADQIHHRAAPFRIAARRHVAFRLVEDDVAMGDVGLDAAAIDLDRVLRGIGLGAELAHGLAVHHHAALENHLLGGASRRDAGGGQDFLSRIMHLNSELELRDL